MSVLLWLLGHWRAVALAILVGAPSVYAVLMRLERDAARSQVAEMTAAARVQEERTKAEVTRQKTITEESDRAHKKRLDRLDADARRLKLELQHASAGIVPAVPDAAGDRGSAALDPAVVCFARDRLSRGIEAQLSSFAERYAGSVLAGAGAIAGFQTCATWAIEESAKATRP